MRVIITKCLTTDIHLEPCCLNTVDTSYRWLFRLINVKYILKCGSLVSLQASGARCKWKPVAATLGGALVGRTRASFQKALSTIQLWSFSRTNWWILPVALIDGSSDYAHFANKGTSAGVWIVHPKPPSVSAGAEPQPQAVGVLCLFF